MVLPDKLLWVDGLGAAASGIVILLTRNWLCEWYRLPLDFILQIGSANLLYGTFSLSLAMRLSRPKVFIWLLVAANLTWALLCWRWMIDYQATASWLGLTHLFLEGLYVAILALLEWRWREQLLSSRQHQIL